MDLTDAVRRFLEAIPANQTATLQILRAKDGETEVSLATPPHLANLNGSLHSSGLITLIEATGLAAVIASAQTDLPFDGVTPLCTAAEIYFHAPAKGFLVARCNLDEHRQALVRDLLDGHTDNIRLTTAVDVSNTFDATVSTGSIRWHIRRTSSVHCGRGRERSRFSDVCPYREVGAGGGGDVGDIGTCFDKPNEQH